jgi:hypothetical protein
MAITAGGSLNSVPATVKQTLQTNYLDLASTSGQGWAQQYVPDLMEQEAEVFGPRTISGFLAQVGAEEAMTADQVVWSEQSRLHLSYKCDIDANNVITIQCDIDELGFAADGLLTHGVRLNDTVIVAAPTGVFKGLVTAIGSGANAGDVTVATYDGSTIPTSGNTADKGTILLVYGSEFVKGVGYNNKGGTHSDTRGANEPQFKSFTNKPIIMKDYYEVSGSDASRIGWVEVSSEAGANGYMWYLKAESDTRARFTDYVEMSMLESEIGLDSTAESTIDDTLYGADGGEKVGTEGLFAAIESRGNLSSGITGVNAATDLAEFDAILAEFDKQGAIEENMFFLNRATSLAIDDMLASMNSYGAGGTSYGVFDNSEDMALNLGFSGFRRGSYDFYKSDFRYLNDLATRGGINTVAGSNAIRGVVIPAGSSSVYDQTVGASIRRPFLHVRFRASQTDDRRMKTWVTGSVGAATSALDAMQLHFLTERCLITQGANNFMLLK